MGRECLDPFGLFSDSTLHNASKIVVLDEATASVDRETDNFVQAMIRKYFQGVTLITIAHRVHTIMDYDKIIVLDSGEVKEFGSPKELLGDKDGMFSSLVKSSGNEGISERS